MGQGRFAALVLVPFALLACSKTEQHDNLPRPAEQTQGATPADTADTPAGPEGQAALIFKARCSTCHGTDGKGNGPASITLNPKPRNYTDPAWQKSVTDDHIAEIIVKGGAALGKSPNMLANPDLADKPDVVQALVKKVRSFAPAGGAAPTTDSGAPDAGSKAGK